MGGVKKKEDMHLCNATPAQRKLTGRDLPSVDHTH